MTYTAITKKRAGPAKGGRSRTRSQIENTLRAGDYPKPRARSTSMRRPKQKGRVRSEHARPKNKRGGGTIPKRFARVKSDTGGLAALETARLVAVDRYPGCCPVVTIRESKKDSDSP